ncbi:MAG: hypothetical protein MJA27_02060 [Pseudanabaenales cyanobacterium]|nr:hypothetical protein [Pseudanabaenales cyanobacterium]
MSRTQFQAKYLSLPYGYNFQLGDSLAIQAAIMGQADNQFPPILSLTLLAIGYFVLVAG